MRAGTPQRGLVVTAVPSPAGNSVCVHSLEHTVTNPVPHFPSDRTVRSQVCRRCFRSSLEETGAVLLCPGGQAEMVHTYRIFKPAAQRELVIHARHKVGAETKGGSAPLFVKGRGAPPHGLVIHASLWYGRGPAVLGLGEGLQPA